MAIKMTLDKHDFANQFVAYGREGQFSPVGLEVLFNYLDDLSLDTEKDIELDVVALCCEYEESSIDEIITQYDIEVDIEDMDEDEVAEAKKEAVEDYLNRHTSICGETEDGFVFASF